MRFLSALVRAVSMRSAHAAALQTLGLRQSIQTSKTSIVNFGLSGGSLTFIRTSTPTEGGK